MAPGEPSDLQGYPQHSRTRIAAKPRSLKVALMSHGWEDADSLGEGRRLPTLDAPRYSQSLERGLAVLGCFTSQRPVLGIADIAEELGMSRSTTHRYAITLVALGYLEQGVTRKYRLGLRVTDLGLSALNGTGLREHSGRYLEELRERSSYTVSLGVLDGPDIVYVDRARSFRRGQSKIDMGLGLGSRLPAYCTSMGKLLLAYLPEQEQRRAIREATLKRRGPNTITTKKALLQELGSIRKTGFAVADQELALGLHSMAAPLRSERREVIAAINIAAHDSMITLQSLVNELGPHLTTTADRISACLGYRRNDESAKRSEPEPLKIATPGTVHL